MPSPYSLLRPEIYVAQLSRLHAKFKTQRRTREPRSAGVSLSDLQDRGDELCAHIAEAVRSETYQFEPLERVHVVADGKRRTIHRATLVDAVVLGALSQRLTAELEGVLDDSVYAYRPARNPQLAIERVCNYLQQHRLDNPDPRQRGLLVLQRDLSAYGESIPTNPTSALWKLVDSVLARVPDRAEARVMESLLSFACRPQVRLASGEQITMDHGLPTGSPIQQPLANLYLSPLDTELRRLGVSFYARFGDDLLLADPTPPRLLAAASVCETVINELGLTFNSRKSKNLYFTGPGRPFDSTSVADGTIGFRPASHVEYLGVRLSFDGKRGLKRKRSRQLLARSRLRIESALRVAQSDDAVEFVAAALGHALHDQDAVTDPATVALRTWVDDRAQLRQLDYLLAQLCAEAISGKRGVRAFRHVPPRTLRAAGLPSLLELRRRSGGNR